jgi:cobalt transporter subunit CbtA
MLRDTLLAAALSGLVAALLLTVVQAMWVTPLILEAETYESAGAAPPHGAESHDHEHDHGDAEEWEPANGWERTSFTLAANLVMGLGYGLVLIGVYSLWRQPGGLWSGVAFGVAGFIVFFAAPSLGLPPELPGTVAAPVQERQLWWAMTALLTGGALLLVFSSPFSWVKAAAAVVLAIAPHVLVVAPTPEVHAALAPEELQHRFQLATTFANAAFWIFLGAASSLAFHKLTSSHGRLSEA